MSTSAADRVNIPTAINRPATISSAGLASKYLREWRPYSGLNRSYDTRERLRPRQRLGSDRGLGAAEIDQARILDTMNVTTIAMRPIAYTAVPKTNPLLNSLGPDD